MAEQGTEIVDTTKFGWCIDGHDKDCIKEFVSGLTKKKYICACKCHQKEK